MKRIKIKRRKKILDKFAGGGFVTITLELVEEEYGTVLPKGGATSSLAHYGSPHYRPSDSWGVVASRWRVVDVDDPYFRYLIGEEWEFEGEPK